MGLDDNRQEGGGEKRGLGGWRGCGIDGQGTDDSDWELDKNTQDTGEKEADSDTKQKTLKPEQGLGEDHSSPVSSTDKVEKDKHKLLLAKALMRVRVKVQLKVRFQV